jgi:hypothetical protein
VSGMTGGVDDDETEEKRSVVDRSRGRRRGGDGRIDGRVAGTDLRARADFAATAVDAALVACIIACVRRGEGFTPRVRAGRRAEDGREEARRREESNRSCGSARDADASSSSSRTDRRRRDAPREGDDSARGRTDCMACEEKRTRASATRGSECAEV